MLKRVIRIELDWLCIPLLLMVFPFAYIEYVIKAWLPKMLGGHPNRKRLRQPSFYATPLSMFWVAWQRV